MVTDDFIYWVVHRSFIHVSVSSVFLFFKQYCDVWVYGHFCSHTSRLSVFSLLIVGWGTPLARMLLGCTDNMVYLTHKWLWLRRDLRNPQALRSRILQMQFRLSQEISYLMSSKHRLEPGSWGPPSSDLSTLLDHLPKCLENETFGIMQSKTDWMDSQPASQPDR